LGKIRVPVLHRGAAQTFSSELTSTQKTRPNLGFNKKTKNKKGIEREIGKKGLAAEGRGFQ
jgi:hypothetical protein